ncbi:uncharacterized protein LOC103365483 [Stegastes partitus]|uniref:Uncharacterized protein LOC103365483 n=1 Tax=Stegastes partitus TaxID=144197 RepID=A0A9Y4N889_9TELE|nr:PREDICTED: uncharacterized protein LOC103365483 [Stegastes partitus]
MVQCCVPCCSNRNDINKEILFYRFSRDEKEKKKWLRLIQWDKFTPNYNSRVCGWHFPDKAAGTTRFAWSDGKAFTKHITPKRVAGPSQNNLNVATQTPSTVVLEIENDMLRQENDKLKQEVEKQKQTFSFSQISSHPDKVNYYTGLPDAATVLFLEALLSKFELKYHFDWNVKNVSAARKMEVIIALIATDVEALNTCRLQGERNQARKRWSF